MIHEIESIQVVDIIRVEELGSVSRIWLLVDLCTMVYAQANGMYFDTKTVLLSNRKKGPTLPRLHFAKNGNSLFSI